MKLLNLVLTLWQWNLTWRRPLRQWEMVQEEILLALIGNFSPHQDAVDSWIWKSSPDGIFSVKCAYSLLQGPLDSGDCAVFKKLWKLNVPLNSILCAWRALLERLPVRANLLRRGIIRSNQEAVCL